MNELEQLTGKGLLIHHWDTDGICSARLILDKLQEKIVANKTPKLGNYYLTKQEIKDCTGFDFIIIVDMSFPEDNIRVLAEQAQVFIFDHHLGKVISEVSHHNPIIKGENPDQYPSASWIVNTYLDNSINLFAILGIIGDHEQKIKSNTIIYPKIQGFCNKNNLTFEQLLSMVNLLDSNYKLGDKEAVEQAPYYLLSHQNAEDILNNTKWKKNVYLLNEEIENILAEPIDSKNHILLKTLDTKSNIISTITRKLAWKYNQNTIVINKGYFTDEDQLYVRTITQDMKPMIQKGKDYGFKCGGKKEVFGAILPKEKTQAFVEEIIHYLSNQQNHLEV